MSCDTAKLLMANNDPGLGEHLSTCASCLIGANAPYYEAPPGLKQKIRRSLRSEETGRAYWRWGAIAASVLLMVSMAANVGLVRSRISAQQTMAEAVLSAHVRSLAGTHLLDVTSTDQHTVKPWFNGKVDFSPPVMTVAGFPLIGGRLEYLEVRPVAALIYGRNKHFINVFVWPAPAAGTDVHETRHGYHLESWSGQGMVFWAVSDLNEAELREFVSLYRRAAGL